MRRARAAPRPSRTPALPTARGKPDPSGSPPSCLFEIRLEQVRMHRGCGGVAAPQLVRVEAHGVEPLRILALAERVGIGEDVRPVRADNRPRLVAAIARKA